MLSIAKVTPKQGENYYKQENYYSQGEANKQSEWFGCGAKTFDLSGSVRAEDFKNLLHGKSPDGKQQLSGKQIDPETHRAGVDMTFSAPKSVSIAALVGGASQLEEAHRTAVRRTLEVIENRYAQARSQVDGKRVAVNTGNLIVAQFHHDTSRDLDPQLHTHCVVLNCTQLENGNWRSLHNDELYNQKMLLGKIYRNELASECQKLGYEIEKKENGLFEIKGYTPEQLDLFAKRSQQIKSAVGENASSKEKEIAALNTRAAKGKERPREQLQQLWQVEGGIIQHPTPEPSQTTSKKSSYANESIDQIDQIVSTAIEHCSERNVNFTREDLEKFVLGEVSQYSFDDLQAAIERNPELLKAKNNQYTTRFALQRELDTIALVNQAQGRQSAITHPEIISSYLESKSLTQGQQDAIALAATTNDQFIAWQGVAGAGKTYALNEFRQIAQVQGYTLKGFAPSSEAAKVLGEEVGIESNTVASLLLSKQDEDVKPKQIWVVDEAGLLSAKDAHNLIKLATNQKAKVILVGDTRQLSAVEAGNPFKSLQSNGMQTAYLNQSLRQKVEDLQQAVDLVAEGKVPEGIRRLEQSDLLKEGRIKIVKDRFERSLAITADYMSLSPDKRQRTLILAGTNAERLAITEDIRKALKIEGSLGQEARITRLKAKDLTSVQLRFSHHYQPGDVVMPLCDYKRLGLEKGGLYTVSDKAEDSLTLVAGDGSSKTVDPAKFYKAVYERQKIEIAEGDRLRWTKNDREGNRRNGQDFTVTAINGDLAEIVYKGGGTDTISLNQAQHLDHALVSTTYSSQGKTADRVLVAATPDRTLSKESFYVAASRAKYDLKIYAESSAALLEKAQESHAKQNPLDVLEEQHKKAKADVCQSLAKVSLEREAKRESMSETVEIAAPLDQQQEQNNRSITR